MSTERERAVEFVREVLFRWKGERVSEEMAAGIVDGVRAALAEPDGQRIEGEYVRFQHYSNGQAELTIRTAIGASPWPDYLAGPPYLTPAVLLLPAQPSVSAPENENEP